MRTKVEIVFRRKVRAMWLEQGLALAAQGATWSDAKPVLAKEVAADNTGVCTISKVLEHVRRVWFEPPDEAFALKTDALRLHRSNTSPDTKLLLNWGMTIAAYPFVGGVGEALGRLLKLQKEACRADVQRRLREQYGDRDFVNRITRYTVSSFLDWGIIVETKPKGIYLSGKQVKPKTPEQLAWLVEALLISRDKTQIAFSELCSHPALFPIVLDTLNISYLQDHSRLRVERQSLNQEFIFLEVPVAQK